MKSHTDWPIPPGYAETVQAMSSRIPWTVLKPWQKSDPTTKAVILIDSSAAHSQPYQYLQENKETMRKLRSLNS